MSDPSTSHSIRPRPLSPAEEIMRDFRAALARSPVLMVRREDSGQHAIPMSARFDFEAGERPGHGGPIWFFTTRDNRLAPGGPAMAQFASLDHALFACLSGRLAEEPDAGLIDRFWSRGVAAWYRGGRADPALLLMRMDIDDIEIWTADLSLKGWFKRLTGGTLQASEAGKHLHEAL